MIKATAQLVASRAALHPGDRIRRCFAGPVTHGGGRGSAMATTETILMAVEDRSTASIVAVEAARVARERATEVVILLHVLDPHSVVCALFSLSGAYASAAETPEDGEAILALAEATLKAEFAATGTPPPEIRKSVVECTEGNSGAAIAHAAEAQGATLIILGARRPHALGRLTHADVRAYLKEHTACPVHVASLQEAPPT
jgi:nucleotide-binding universal stress UspA family protein